MKLTIAEEERSRSIRATHLTEEGSPHKSNISREVQSFQDSRKAATTTDNGSPVKKTISLENRSLPQLRQGADSNSNTQAHARISEQSRQLANSVSHTMPFANISAPRLSPDSASLTFPIAHASQQSEPDYQEAQSLQLLAGLHNSQAACNEATSQGLPKLQITGRSSYPA